MFARTPIPTHCQMRKCLRNPILYRIVKNIVNEVRALLARAYCIAKKSKKKLVLSARGDKKMYANMREQQDCFTLRFSRTRFFPFLQSMHARGIKCRHLYCFRQLRAGAMRISHILTTIRFTSMYRCT